MTFTHRVRAAGGVLVVALQGEMDLSVSDSAETVVARLIAQRHPTVLHIDVADLRFLDSTGVSVLVRLWRLARRERCLLRVVNATGMVRQVLEVTGALAIVGGAPEPEVAPDQSGERADQSGQLGRSSRKARVAAANSGELKML